MIIVKKYTLLLIFVSLFSQQAYANRTSTAMEGWYLRAACAAGETKNAEGFCKGAIEAYYSLMPNWCVPNDISHGEIKRHVISKMKTMPDNYRQMSAEKFVWKQISKKWPCD